jgi:putative cardiolipin synthase
MRIPVLILALGLFASTSFAATLAQRFEHDYVRETKALMARHPGQSAFVVLDKGEKALLARAWLAAHARHSLDVQYFIWSDDNIGRLGLEALLAAAKRGVHVRLLVDDLLMGAPSTLMLALARQPNFELRIYNANSTVGVSFWRRWFNVATQFRGVNQRMHNKIFVSDGLVGITGGRNLAAEYFDYDHEFNFRDRELLVAGPVARSMEAGFESFWVSELAQPVRSLLPGEDQALSNTDALALRDGLHRYAEDPAHFSPLIRSQLEHLAKTFGALLKELVWASQARYVTDLPGKNPGDQGLGGGGQSTLALAEVLRGAQHQVTLQSPYCILTPQARELFRSLVARGVKVRISTNSLANNDNLQAQGGYLRQRADLLKDGLQLREYKPEPAILQKLLLRYPELAGERPIFVLHAKTLVVDSETLFIGTFNLDPRSMNLNTESGVIVQSKALAGEVERAIEADMAPENSWDPATDPPERFAPRWRRIKAWCWGRLPLLPIL